VYVHVKGKQSIRVYRSTREVREKGKGRAGDCEKWA